MADETLPIRIVETTTTTNEVGHAVSVMPARYVDADTAVDEVGNAIETVPFEEVEGLVTLNSAGQAVPVIPVRIVETVTALTETGTSVLALALRGAGGTPTPPFAFPEDEMLLGMGMAGISSYSGYYPFANVLWNADKWVRNSGSGAYTHEWGVLTAASPTDEFYSKFAEGLGTDNLPAGTYTVLNPDGLEIGVGWGGNPSLTGWTTATEFTFTAAGSVIALWAKGSVTNNIGPIQIIMPGRRDAFIAGDYWNPDFITFLTGLSVKCLRFMDWLATYGDITESWSEVPTGIPMMFNASTTKQARKVPYALIIDLCNLLGINPWICLPARADASFRDGLAALLNADLDAALYAYIEYGNEVWNPGASYIDARNWVDYLDHTQYLAASNIGINGWTYTGHGLATGDIVSVYHTKQNYQTTDNPVTWPLGWGNGLYVEAVDANNFKLYSDVGRTTVVPPTATTPFLLYKDRIEAGKTAGVEANYGETSLQIWNSFDAAMGRNRVIHVLGTQGVSGSVTTNRLAPTGVSAATDVISPASYYSGDWFIGLVDIASGQVTPKAWARRAGDIVRVAVYAAGSAPTLAEVGAGGGTGYVGHRDLTITVQDATSYTTGAAITGLSNGTDYEIFVLMTSVTDGFKWLATDTITASATPSTVTISDSHAAMAMRARRNIVVSQVGIVNTQKAVAVGKPLVFYECGSDYFGPGQNIPAELEAWRTSYTQSPEAGDVFDFFYNTMAANDMKLANQFVDINVAPGVFNIAESFDDTSDYRYLKFVGYGGQITKPTPFNIADIVASNVLIEPSYPAVVHTFADAGLTYSIFNGDVNSNFAIVGNQLRMVNGYATNWAVPTSRSLVIEASNGVTNDYFTISFATGFAWYEADAKFAWSSIDDSNNAEINPIIGGALPRTTGAGATVAAGLWDMDGNVYSGTTAMATGLDTTKPFLIAGVFDKDNLGSTSEVWQATGSMYFQMNGGNFRYRYLGGSTYNHNFLGAGGMPTGKHVYWAYYDGAGTLTTGYDQTENATTLPMTTAGTNTTRMRVGNSVDSPSSSQAKHGSMQVVSRTTMSKATAKAIVANMQLHHSIP